MKLRFDDKHMRKNMLVLMCCAWGFSGIAMGQDSAVPYDTVAMRFFTHALRNGQAYEMLHELTSTIGNRISGSPQAELAVSWVERKMNSLGLQNVHREPVKVPRWQRGKKEEVKLLLPNGTSVELNALALGGSVATPAEGITAEVIEVHSLQEAASLGEKAKGRIVFYNRPFDPGIIDAYQGYGAAVDQRVGGATAAAQSGALMTLVRSMTPEINDIPHTGIMIYADTVTKIPSVAISTQAAELLSKQLKQHPSLKVFVRTYCQWFPEVESYNVVGELVGSEYPHEVIVIGSHLDSWDVGQGAHDDGVGVVQSLEAVRLMSSMGMRPKRTIRVVAFMTEEFGVFGGRVYAEKQRPGEHCIAAMESDRGGFMPRGFAIEADSTQYARLARWQYLFKPVQADRITPGEGDADVSFLARKGVPSIALYPESARYFSIHHTTEDTFDKVNERELEIGAACMSIFSYVLAQEGI